MTGSRRAGAVTRARVPVFDRATRGARTIIERAAKAANLPGRGVWSRPGRHHIEVRGVARVGSEGLARRVEEALTGLAGVAWARVNAPSGRVVVAVRHPEPRLADLITTIASAERTRGMLPAPDVAQPHPPEEGPRTPRALSTMAADALGLGISAATRILPFTRAPGELAGLANVVDLHPRLHIMLGEALHGRERADSVLPMVEALAQGMTGGWAGILVDGAQRIWQWYEARAQLVAWAAAEERLSGTPEWAAAAPIAAERPRPKPHGPVQRYSARILDAGGLVAGLALPVAGFKRAAALGLATLPKAAVAAREAYGAHIGAALARRGVIAIHRGVLRELDRIDTLVLDEAALRSDRVTLTDLAPLPGTDAEEVAARAFALFEPDQPDAVRRMDDWSLGPLDRLEVPERGTEQARRLSDGGGTVLGLATGDRLAAAIRVDPEPARGLEMLVAAARRSRLRLVVAGDDQQRHGFADALMPGGRQLAGSVRDLQAAGATVMLVSAHQPALAAADCGLGVCHPGAAPPWGAHLLLGPDLDEAALIVDAAGVARTVAEQGIALAGAGTGLGAILALTSERQRLPGRSLAAVNAAAGLAFANGAWRAYRLHSQPVVPTAATAPWHLMPGDTVLARLSSDPAGLPAQEVRRRCRVDDEVAGGLGLANAFVEELANPLTPVLAAGAGLSAAVGSPVDAGLVGGVVAVSAMVGAAQRVRTERSLAALLSRSAVAARYAGTAPSRSSPPTGWYRATSSWSNPAMSFPLTAACWRRPAWRLTSRR